MKDSMIRSFSWFEPDILKQSSRPEWPVMLHNLCFLHAAIQLRARFGQGGWNCPQDFFNIGYSCLQVRHQLSGMRSTVRNDIYCSCQLFYSQFTDKAGRLINGRKLACFNFLANQKKIGKRKNGYQASVNLFLERIFFHNWLICFVEQGCFTFYCLIFYRRHLPSFRMSSRNHWPQWRPTAPRILVLSPTTASDTWSLRLVAIFLDPA